MKIALIGAYGQLGTDLRTCLDGELVPLGHRDIELTDPQSVQSALSQTAAEFVINTAAYNLVDGAEDEPHRAFHVNALGVRNLARWCEAHDVPLLHVSTDYVFGLESKRGIPLSETDTPGPVNAYGVSKLAGEYFVRAICRRHFIVRTCGLYGRTAARKKGNFVETMLRLAEERDELRVVDDQLCTPTATTDLARGIGALIETNAYGLYHATNSGSASWFNFAREIFRLSKIDVTVRPISSSEFPAKAARPAFSVLDNNKLTETIGFELPPWQAALERYLADRSL